MLQKALDSKDRGDVAEKGKTKRSNSNPSRTLHLAQLKSEDGNVVLLIGHLSEFSDFGI